MSLRPPAAWPVSRGGAGGEGGYGDGRGGGPGERDARRAGGRAERARAARAFVSEVLGHGHPCGEDAALLVSEIAWSFTPGCLLNARPGGHRAADGEGAARPGRAGAELPSSTESGFEGSFSLSAPELGARGAGIPGCYGRFDVPGVDLFCSCRVPERYLGRHFRRSWPCPVAARRWFANRFHRPARRGVGAGDVCVLRADAVLALARGRRAGASGPRRARPAAGAVCSHGSAARRTRRGAGGGSTGTGKTWQPTGDGFAGHGPAGSRPARSACLRRPAPLPEPEGRRPGSRG